MIIVFLPAVDSIRTEWREATESLGGNTFQYWTRVACPDSGAAFHLRVPAAVRQRVLRVCHRRGPCSPSGRFSCR